MAYKDAQRETVSYFPTSFEETEAALMLGEWEKRKPGEDLWLVFATCEQEAQTLRFVYPICAPPATSGIKIGRYAQEQHEYFQRPPVSGPVQVVRVTPELIAELISHARIQEKPAVAECDFCCSQRAIRMYDAEDFVMFSGRISVAGWAACPECAQRVDAGDKEALVRRMAGEGGIETDHGKELVRRQVNDFFAHFKGSSSSIRN